MKQGLLRQSPITKRLAAISCGISGDNAILDLDYIEDSRAQVDMNLVMTLDAQGEAEFVEIQGTGEGRPFKKDELNALLALGEKGIRHLMQRQDDALGDTVHVIGQKPILVLASGNFGKLREMRALLSDRFDVISMREALCDIDVEEDGETFAENALIKAQAVSAVCGMAALADDSGLCVDALCGAPGVHSARFAGVHGDDEANNKLLLERLKNAEDRRARFVCAMALVRPGKKPIVCEGESYGTILYKPRGEDGFGYDPLFLSDDLGVTFAEADAAEKNTVSHRARAISALIETLEREDD